MPLVEEKWKQAVMELRDEIFEVSLWLTEHPETTGNEVESCKYLVNFLRNHGYDVETPCGTPHSFKAKYREGRDSGYPKIAVMCEYDALPEVGHACGHSLSSAISILTAFALRKAYPDLPLEIDLVGTPAEEGGGGKIHMVKNHAFDEYDLAIMNHLEIENCPHNALLACAATTINFYGEAAPASAVNGRNAFNAAQLFVHATDMLRQHITKDCQMQGIITYGGSAANSVPERNTLKYCLRADNLEKLKDLCQKVEKCAQGAAIATNCEYEVVYNGEPYADIFYPYDTVEEIINIYKELGMTYRTLEQGETSSDVGNVDRVVPTLEMFCKASEDGVQLHTREMVPLLYGERGKQTLYEGALVMGAFLVLLAYNPEKFEHLKEEHRRYYAR